MDWPLLPGGRNYMQIPRPMSPRQLGILRDVHRGAVASKDDMIVIHQTSLWSVLYRGYIRLVNGRVVLTEDGEKAFNIYSTSRSPTRESGDELAARVKEVLAGKLAKTLRKGAARGSR